LLILINIIFIQVSSKKETYNMITSAYRIREKSDYDDFYVAAKDDAQEQLENAKRFLGIVENYLEKNNII